jgi:sensor histidine kinase regulating citrate/malate metabolism
MEAAMMVVVVVVVVMVVVVVVVMSVHLSYCHRGVCDDLLSLSHALARGTVLAQPLQATPTTHISISF